MPAHAQEDQIAEIRSRFRTLDLASSQALEAAVITLRMIEGQRWHRRLCNTHGVPDEDVLTLVGLEFIESHEDPAALRTTQLRTMLAIQRQKLEKRFRRRPDLLDRNIAKLATMLRLNETEQAILRVAVITTRRTEFADLFSLSTSTPNELVRALRDAIGCSARAIEAAISPGGTLRRGCLFERSDIFSFDRCNPLEMSDITVQALLGTRFDEERFLRHLIRPAPTPSLTLEDFSHIRCVDVALHYLRQASSRRRRGVNLLIYGAPGTGKTEFVRALAAQLELQLHEVPTQDKEGESIGGRRRFGAYSVCQGILAPRRRQLLLFDEVEDVFGDSAQGSSLEAMMGVRGRFQEPVRKGWINQALETNRVPTVWVCNTIDGLDPAYVRRFDLALEFDMPGPAVRRRIIDRYFGAGMISERCATRLAGIEHLSPANVESAARVARSLRHRDVAKRDAVVERVIQASLKAMGCPHQIVSPALPAHYDTAFLNADKDVDALAKGLGRHPQARICLYGRPGTGKTAFAHHVARQLALPIIVKRGSDLIRPFVGRTEIQLAAAFHQASNEGAILLIDEVDGFLRNRTNAQQSWEVTFVNELLTQMEAFEGIFIASTNLLETLDEASLRRFDFKIRFDPMSREQVRNMFQRIATDAGAIDPALLERLDRLTAMTPGDFANVLRQLRLVDRQPTAERLLDLLAAEASIKPEARRRSIGFTVA